MFRIKKVSSYLLSFFNLLLVALPLYVLSLWLFIDTPSLMEAISEGLFFDPVQTPEGMINLSMIRWDPLTKFIGFMSSVVGFFPLFLGIFVLKAVFGNYKKGKILNLHNARYYKYLSWLFFLDALIAKPLSGMLMVLAVTLTYPPSYRWISIGYGTPTLGALFCGILMIVISWVMVEGYKLQLEQKYTI